MKHLNSIQNKIYTLSDLIPEDEEEDEDDVEVIEQEKQKLIMDFGLAKKQPERVNIEVLRDMIKDNPESMAVAARRWLAAAGDDKDDENGDGPKDGTAS